MTRKSCFDYIPKPDKPMNKYELLYIVGTQYTDTEVSEIQGKIVAMLEKVGANILRNENLGKIRFAYPIKKARHGTYILVHFDADPAVVQALNRQLELTDEILRHTLLVRVPGSEKKKIELIPYVAPLSEEAKRSEAKPTIQREKSTPVEELVIAAPLLPAEPAMSMEELDRKLDEILDADLSEKV